MASSFEQALSNYDGGVITSQMAAWAMQMQWGSKVSNVSAMLDSDIGSGVAGFDIFGVETATGQLITNYTRSAGDIQTILENLQTGTPDGSNSETDPSELFFSFNDALDKDFTLYDISKKFYNLPSLVETGSKFVQAAESTVTAISAYDGVRKTINAANQGNTGTAVYEGVKVAGTIILAIVCPEGLLLWGIETLVADTIMDAYSDK
jgi:hypothetical protein